MRRAAPDMALHSGDSIRTGEGAYAEIAFDEDKITRIDSGSHVTILLRENEKLELIDGDVFCAIKNLPGDSSFEIRTPMGISGAGY